MYWVQLNGIVKCYTPYCYVLPFFVKFTAKNSTKNGNFDRKIEILMKNEHGNFHRINQKFREILVTKCKCVKAQKQLNRQNSVLNFRRPKILISNILTRKRTHLIALWVHILSVYYKNTDNPIIAGLPIICMIKNENTFLVNLLFFIYQIYYFLFTKFIPWKGN